MKANKNPAGCPDSDFTAADLFEAIEKGAFPEWGLAVQLFHRRNKAAPNFPFDFSPGSEPSLIPEKLVPLKVIGRMGIGTRLARTASFCRDGKQVCPTAPRKPVPESISP